MFTGGSHSDTTLFVQSGDGLQHSKLERSHPDRGLLLPEPPEKLGSLYVECTAISHQRLEQPGWPKHVLMGTNSFTCVQIGILQLGWVGEDPESMTSSGSRKLEFLKCLMINSLSISF